MPPRHAILGVRMNIYIRIRHLRKFTTSVFALLLFTFAVSANAHEFWLEPDSYTPVPGAKVSISHSYGQYFKGDGLPYVGEWHQRYVVADGTRERKVSGFDGDLPAIQTSFSDSGLKVFGYFGTPEPQVYDNLEKFEKYVQKVGLDHIARRHRELGKSNKKIRELYARNAKMLLGVGSASGNDRALDLPLELIAEQNPYTLKPGASLPVQLLYRGKPISGIAIITFSQKDPKNPVKTVTDADGRSTIALPAPGAYLLNAVHMFEPAAGEKSDWTSLWASLTFALR